VAGEFVADHPDPDVGEIVIEEAEVVAIVF